ncbi:glycosyltransferase family 4 protein [Methanohalophilus sp. RSK]|uniref:glycosyltransferase family 4 protein n=1 Tax=Methanohalophilus sp. RSK TaxID=2485783 RepID=UPI0013148DD3|nr:glycosyltransferase family 4 protein [Methanohalophilus sp. RSK]
MVYNGFLNSGNGSNTHIIELAENLSKTIDLTLFIRKSTPSTHSNLNIVNVPVANIFPFTAISHQFMLLFYLLYYSIIKKPDIIYCRQDGFSFSPSIVKIILRKPYIIEINGILSDEGKLLKSSLLGSKLKSFSEKINYQLADRIIAVTNGVKEGIIEQYNINPMKIDVISNGANINLFKPHNREKCKLDLDLALNRSYICFVGNLAPWQGVEYLIKAAPMIIEKKTDTMFLIVGDGIMKNDWMRLAEKLNISDHFLFTGSVPYEKVPIYINASDVCVVPKKPLNSGYSPLKLYEYMACGKPIIASNINGFGILKQINGGLLINSEDPQKFSQSTLKLLYDIPLRDEMGINGREYVEKHQSWEVVSKKVLTVCKDIIEEKY